jgi:hypothetical protein
MVIAGAGRFADAMAHVKKLLEAGPDPVWELSLAYVAAIAGERAIAEKILAKNEGATAAALSYFSATIFGVWGEFDRAFAELGKTRENRFGVLASAAVNPAFDALRSDPRWKPFLRTLNYGIEI